MTTNRVKKRSKVGDGVLQAVYICLGLTIAFPIIYAVLISFMEPSQVLAGGVNLIPKKWTLENYKTALTSAPLMRFMLNSLILALGASVVRLAVSSLAAFAFAFLDFPCKNVIFNDYDSGRYRTGCELPYSILTGVNQYLSWYDDCVFCFRNEYFPAAPELFNFCSIFKRSSAY